MRYKAVILQSMGENALITPTTLGYLCAERAWQVYLRDHLLIEEGRASWVLNIQLRNSIVCRLVCVVSEHLTPKWSNVCVTD